MATLQLQILTLSSLLTALERDLGLVDDVERLSVVYVFTSVWDKLYDALEKQFEYKNTESVKCTSTEW